MADKRGARWALIAAGVFCVLVLAFLVFAPPYIVRYELQNTLPSYDIQARIANVDANIFTGQVSIDNARGHGPNGDVFRIGHAALDIDYAPLLDKHIALTRLVVSGARLSVRRTTDQGLKILGIPLLPKASDSQGSHWGLGIGQTNLANVVLHYREPGRNDLPAVDQGATVTQASAGSFATWQPDQTTPLTIDLAIDDGRLRLDGRMAPLAAKQTAHFKVKAQRFPMPALAPLARMAGWHGLAGTFDAEQQLDISYRTGHGLGVALNGQSTWHRARAVTSDGTHLSGQTLGWHGQARLQRDRNRPGMLKANGKLTLASVKVGRPDQFDFSQANAQWQGKAHAELAAKTSRITTQGDLSARRTRLNAPGWLSLSSARESLHGSLDLTLAADQSVISSNGRFKAESMSFSIPDAIRFDSAALDWNGKTSTALAKDGTHIQTDGSLASDRLVFDVPQTSHVVADHVDWQGTTRMHSAALFSRTADGHLTADNPRLEIAGPPMKMTADRFIFDGHYAEQPDAGHDALRLSLSGHADSANLAVMDTAIKAPWFDAMQLDADGIAIDSLNAIGLDKLTATGVRMLGDTNTNSAVMQAVSMKARKFSLTDLTHYSLANLSVSDANIHTRRDATGMGVISEFVNSVPSGDTAGSTPPSSGGNDTATSSNKNDDTARSTFAIKHLHLSGPAIAFVDTAMTPTVNLTGSNLDFNLDDLNTAKPDQNATFKLSLDIGAYGHFDSRGKIAPFAPSGPNLDIDGWLRSLALAPMSGYLNAAMGRKIANGAADGTLNISATNGELNGLLDATIANFRLANSGTKETEITLGISMNTALKLIRGQDDLINFKTKILGDVTTPYFSITNLVREAVLAGLRTALLSDYSPVGLLNKAKNTFLNLFRSVEGRPAIFEPGKHYARPDDRKYLALIAQAMASHPDWTLHIAGQAVTADARQMGLSGVSAGERHARLKKLARQRQEAISDYLAARNVNPARIVAGDPSVVESEGAKPAVKFSLDKK